MTRRMTHRLHQLKRSVLKNVITGKTLAGRQGVIIDQLQAILDPPVLVRNIPADKMAEIAPKHPVRPFLFTHDNPCLWKILEPSHMIVVKMGDKNPADVFGRQTYLFDLFGY